MVTIVLRSFEFPYVAGTSTVLIIFWSFMIGNAINENEEKIDTNNLKRFKEELFSRVLAALIKQGIHSRFIHGRTG